MSKRATKQETELRVAHAAELVAEGQAFHQLLPLLPQNMEYQEEEQEKSQPRPTFY